MINLVFTKDMGKRSVQNSFYRGVSCFPIELLERSKVSDNIFVSNHMFDSEVVSEGFNHLIVMKSLSFIPRINCREKNLVFTHK